MAEAKSSDAKRFTLARQEKLNADIIRKQNLARVFILSALSEEIEQEDMSVALQDGVLLCKLINYYKPDSIKKFNANPRIPFKMMENAAYVIDFCKKNGIAVSFTAEDICNKEHLILILGFILTIAERMGWSPDAASVSSSLNDSGNLAAAPTPSPSPPSPSHSPSPSPSSPSHSPSPPPSHKASTPPTKPSPSLSPPQSAATSLKSIFDDLIASEKEFLQDMELFFKLYVLPAKTLLPSDKTNNIFGNIENLVGANNKFLVELQMVQDGFMNIATVWDNFATAINIYSVYCIFQQHSFGIVEQCRREHQSFDALLRSVECTPESKNGNIFNFLVKPFSRVVKYNSALKQLLQLVLVGSEDHQSLADVKKQFQDLHDTTNDTWKKVENSRKIAEIAGKLVGAEKAGLRKLGRIYLREGDFLLNGKPARLFLFSDIIMYAAPVKAILKKSGGKSHIFKGILPLNACSFQDLPDGKDGKNAMEVTTSVKSYKIQASTASDKRLWVSDIKKCIAKLSGASDPLSVGTSSPLGPRPMLDLGRRVPGPIRQDSLPQMVEERRKTIKLGFSSAGHASISDDSEEEKPTLIEESDEVQLEIKSGGGLTEEDRRKTIKLEFGIPQRQLTIRDRSKTVELGFKKKETEETNEDHEEKIAIQSGGDVIKVQIDEAELTLQQSDTESKSDSDDVDSSQEVNHSQELQQNIAEEMEEQNKDILASDFRDNFDSDTDSPDEIHKERDFQYVRDKHNEAEATITEDAVSNNEELMLSDNQLANTIYQPLLHVERHNAERHDAENKTEHHNAEKPDAGDEAEQHNTKMQDVEIYDAEPHDDEPHDDEPHDDEPHDDEPHDDEPHDDEPHDDEPHDDEPHDNEPHDDEPHDNDPHDNKPRDAERHSTEHDIEKHDAERYEHYYSKSHRTENLEFASEKVNFGNETEGHENITNVESSKLSIQKSEHASIVVLQEEIKQLKKTLTQATQLIQSTAQELEKEREETKIWKARVERILAVLLDTMKHNTGGVYNV